MKNSCSFESSQYSSDSFLEKIESAPPLVTKEEVDKYLPKELQFDSAEDLMIWENTAPEKKREKRRKGLEELYALIERRFWLIDFIQPN